MKKTQKIRWTALGAKTSVAILVTAALLMLALSAVQSYYARLAPHSKWPIVGYVGVLCALLIFATYSVIAGWTLEYIYKAATNSFHGENLALIEHEFATFHNTGWLNVLLQAIFIWFCLIFFILLAIAGLTSTIALLEVVVAYLSEELHLSRKWATVIASAATLFIGVFAALSLEEGTHLTIGKFSFNDFLDFLTANIMLPLGGLLIVIFLGWRMGKTEFFAEVTNEGALKVPLKSAVFFIIRYLAPLAILVVFISGFVN